MYLCNTIKEKLAPKSETSHLHCCVVVVPGDLEIKA